MRPVTNRLAYKIGRSPYFVSVAQETGQRADGTLASKAAPNVAVPSAGERFSDEELHARYDVPMHGDVRVSRENMCIVLVRQAEAHRGHADTDRGTYVLHIGQNSDESDRQGQVMREDSLALRRSKEEGYTVLYFTKEGGALEFNSRVEYASHESHVETGGGGRSREVVKFRLRAVGGEAARQREPTGGPPAAATEGAARECPYPSAVAMIERAISMQSNFKSRAHLIRALPGDVDMETLDRALEHLLHSSKISIDGDIIRWVANADGPGVQAGHKEGSRAAEPKPSFAGTFLEGIGDGKAPNETVGEYIVRLVNADEPGVFDGEDAKEIDEDLCQMAKGEYYTHEQMRKEFGLWHTRQFLEGMRAGASGMHVPKCAVA